MQLYFQEKPRLDDFNQVINQAHDVHAKQYKSVHAKQYKSVHAKQYKSVHAKQ